MPNAIDGLKPAGLWQYFAELSKIPRPSKHEAAAAAFVVGTAKKLGLECAQDTAGTVVVRKPASPGYENRPMVCLQGHLDMVPEKRPDKKHDFLKDPITLVRKGNTMMADGTTLGADNGVAVATSLAIMADTVARARPARVPLHHRRGDRPHRRAQPAARVPEEPGRC